MGKRAAIYVRVSTDKQTVENQLRELHRIAERQSSAIEVSPRRPSSTMRIFSSAAWCFRVARRMLRTSASDDAGVELDFCLAP